MKKPGLTIFIAVFFYAIAPARLNSSGPVIFSAGDKALLRADNIMTFVYMKGKGNAVSNVADTSAFLNISVLPQGWDRFDVVIVEKAYLRVGVSDSSRLKIFKTLAGRSGLKGMKYYSITETGIRSLIIESFRVKSCGDRTYIAEENLSALPAKSESVFVIQDNRMGTICFNGTVEYRDGMFIETDVSCGRVSRLGMSVFNDGGYVIRHYLLPDPSGAGYFYCSVQIMKVESSIMKRLNLLNPRNFGNRVRGETVHFFRRMGYDVSGMITAFR